MARTSILAAAGIPCPTLIDPGSKTITVPKSGNMRFYRLSSGTAYTLGRPTISGSNVVLTYQ